MYIYIYPHPSTTALPRVTGSRHLFGGVYEDGRIAPPIASF